MRNWLVGAGMVIGGALLIPLLIVLGLSQKIATIVSIVVAVCGFAVQMYAAFSMRASFRREQRLARQKHEAIMRKAKELSPEQAISLLLEDGA